MAPILKRSNWLRTWNPRDASIFPAEAGRPARIEWHGGAQPGSITLDCECIVKRESDRLIITVNPFTRDGGEHQFRATGGDSLNTWHDAIALAMVPPPEGCAAVPAATPASPARALNAAAPSSSERAPAAVLYVAPDCAISSGALPPHQPEKHVRIVCVSDTHTQEERLRVPAGDLLVHAGDALFNGVDVGRRPSIERVAAWLGEQHGIG